MENKREKVFKKTDGYCHLCHKKLTLRNYGLQGASGAWHIEHSVPKARGGTDSLNNLFPACISCNISKGTKSTRSVRNKKGLTRAPYSKAKKDDIREHNTLLGMASGAVAGAIFGPPGVILGSIVGAMLGDSNSPKK